MSLANDATITSQSKEPSKRGGMATFYRAVDMEGRLCEIEVGTYLGRNYVGVRRGRMVFYYKGTF